VGEALRQPGAVVEPIDRAEELHLLLACVHGDAVEQLQQRGHLGRRSAVGEMVPGASGTRGRTAVCLEVHGMQPPQTLGKRGEPSGPMEASRRSDLGTLGTSSVTSTA
jgi:hypothetical protein